MEQDNKPTQPLDTKPAQPSDTLPEEESPKYTPRPWWHRVLAGVLCAVVILGVILYYYWIMHKF